MASAVPMFYDDVAQAINWAMFLLAVVLQAVAFVHCLLQRSDAFPVVGTLPKPGWLVILGVGTVLTLLLGTRMLIFMLIGIGAAALYLLDVRPGIRDATEGHGPW